MTKADMATVEEHLGNIRTPKGGYRKADLAELGIPWPPPKGWKERLLKEINGEIVPLGEWRFMPDDDKLRCNDCRTYTTIGEALRPDGKSRCGSCGSTDMELM